MNMEPSFGLPGFEQELTPIEVQRGLLDFERAVEDVRHFPPGDSKVVTACMEAIQCDLHDDKFPEFKSVIEGFIKDRPEMNGHLKVQLFWRVFQHILLKRDDRDRYPADYVNRLTWQIAFRTALDNNDADTNPEGWEVQELLATQNIQTNEPKRYSGVKIAVDAFSNILPERPSYVDAGCSAGLGQIQLGENIPFRGIDIKTNSPSVRRRVRAGLVSSLGFSSIVGFDKITGTSIEWVDACSNPKELTNTERNRERRRYRQNLVMLQNNYRRVHGDLTEGYAGVEGVLSENGGNPYDIASSLTTFYEIPLNLQPTAMKTFESLTNKLAVVVDFAEVNKDDPTQIITAKNIYDPSSKYRLLAKLVDSDDSPWQVLGTYDNGRCGSFRPDRALLERYAKLDL